MDLCGGRRRAAGQTRTRARSTDRLRSRGRDACTHAQCHALHTSLTSPLRYYVISAACMMWLTHHCCSCCHTRHHSPHASPTIRAHDAATSLYSSMVWSAYSPAARIFVSSALLTIFTSPLMTTPDAK